MKVKVTKKALKYTYPKALAIPFNDAYYLLKFQEPYYYMAGVYGWNFDGYLVDGVLVTTGYRGLIGKPTDRQLLKEYEEKAKQIYLDRNIHFDQIEKMINQLLHEYINKEVANYDK